MNSDVFLLFSSILLSLIIPFRFVVVVVFVVAMYCIFSFLLSLHHFSILCVARCLGSSLVGRPRR